MNWVLQDELTGWGGEEGRAERASQARLGHVRWWDRADICDRYTPAPSAILINQLSVLYPQPDPNSRKSWLMVTSVPEIYDPLPNEIFCLIEVKGHLGSFSQYSVWLLILGL